LAADAACGANDAAAAKRSPGGAGVFLTVGAGLHVGCAEMRHLMTPRCQSVLSITLDADAGISTAGDTNFTRLTLIIS